MKNHIRCLRLVLAVSFVVALLPTQSSAETPEADREGRYTDARQLAVLRDEEIRESSGIAACLARPDAFWTHNDSGDEARLFLFDTTGKTLATVTIDGARAQDWEDICSFHWNETNYLLIGDFGDNGRKRESRTLYLIKEPRIDALRAATPSRVHVDRSMEFRFEDGPHDCESVAVDAHSGKILLVTKQKALDCPVYELPLDFPVSHSALAAKVIGRVKFPAVTAMDISPDGRRMVILTYLDAFEYTRREDQTWTMALESLPRRIALPRRRQGEALCYGRDGRSLYLTSEGTSQPFWEVPFVPRRQGERAP